MPSIRCGGIPYFDGALGDPVPVQKAFDCGCEKTVVILTKPERELRTSNQDEKICQTDSEKISGSGQSA